MRLWIQKIMKIVVLLFINYRLFVLKSRSMKRVSLCILLWVNTRLDRIKEINILLDMIRIYFRD